MTHSSLASPIPVDIAGMEAFLDAHPEVQFVEVIFTALSGVPRGKRVRRSELRAIYMKMDGFCRDRS